MKVILLQDVAKVGRRFDIVDVPDGYGMNKLIPKHLAEPATPENVKRVNQRAAQNEAQKAEQDEQFAAATAALEGKTVTVSAETNEDGKLFQALKADRIVDALQKEAGVTIDPAQVVIKVPIKTTGEHTIELASGTSHVAVTITVEKQ